MSRFDPSSHVTPSVGVNSLLKELWDGDPGSRCDSRLFYSTCVGRCWRQSLRCAPYFFIRTTRKYSTGRKYVALPTQSFTAYHRHNAIFFTVCKITLMQYHKRRSRAVYLFRWRGKTTRKANEKNSMYLTRKEMYHYQPLPTTICYFVL